MLKDNNHIETIFRESFSDFSVQPSHGLWGRIAGKLFRNQFLSFDISSFNVYYLSAAIGVVTTGIVLFSGPSDEKIAQNENEASAFVETTADKKAEAKAKEVEVPKTTSISEDFPTETEETRQETHVAPKEQTKTIERPEEDNLEQIKTKDKAKAEASAYASTFSAIRADSADKKATADREAKENEELELILKPPVADYTPSATQGCGTLKVSFKNNSLNADSYVWHFGDGKSSTDENPAHIYDEPGEYEVWLEATGAGGATKVYGEVIRVYEPPEANFVISPEVVTIPEEPVTFYNHSKNASRHRWDFGDLSTSTETEPTHYYMDEGKYDVRLDVWNEAGCHDSMIVQDAFASSGCRIEFPTAFAPNPNGPSNGYYNDGPTGNEVFHPVCQGVVEYHLRIYNRNGSLVFESNDINIGWDGYIKGSLAKQDVYVWKASGRFQNGKSFVRSGNVTLIVKR